MGHLLFILQESDDIYKLVKGFKSQKVIFTVLVSVLFCCILFCFPLRVSAKLLTKKPLCPPYLEQLEAYKNEVMLHKAEQERIKKKNTPENDPIQHIVKPGETLSSIARTYNTSLTSLVNWNRLQNPHLIRKGQIINIFTVEGIMTGQENTATMAALASCREDRRQAQGQGNISVPSFQWPLVGEITSYYGWRNGTYHYGLDIAAPIGTIIKAAAPGHVIQTGLRNGYGLALTIDHGKGWGTLYAHNSANLVREGDRVIAGQPIAKVGASGNATGPHLHLEIILDGNKLDPLSFLPECSAGS